MIWYIIYNGITCNELHYTTITHSRRKDYCQKIECAENITCALYGNFARHLFLGTYNILVGMNLICDYVLSYIICSFFRSCAYYYYQFTLLHGK